MRKLLAGIAAVAMAATITPLATQAQPGKDKGQGNDKAQSAHKGGGPAHAQNRGAKNQNPGQAKANRGSSLTDRGPQAKSGHSDRGPDKAKANNAPKKAQGNRGNGQTFSNRKADGPSNPAIRSSIRGQGNAKSDRGYRDDYDDRRRGNFVERIARLPYRTNHGLIDGCPPGLRKKNPPCVPPGLARNDGYYGGPRYRPSFFGIGGIGNGSYYYDDGYLFRLGTNNRVSGFIPLLGGALSIGNRWPSYYEPAPLSPYYREYYHLDSPQGYRYADNVLYRVNPETAAITSIAALLTGDEFRIGQPMPAGYDVYNVPYGYRDRYYDRPDAYYRYSDGYIYQVDPETRLIAAAIEMLL